MNEKRFFYAAVVFFIILIGCGSGPQTLSVLMHCDDDCNESNAIVVTLFQLKNSDKFEHASYESLLKDPEGILSEELIPGSRYEKIMIPGEDFQLNNLEVKAEAKFFGIIGDFNSPAKNGWKQVVPVDAETESVNILIHKNFLSALKKD